MVMRADADDRARREAEGWTVVARSFGAQLDADRIDRRVFEAAVARVPSTLTVRELGPADVDALLTLDARTLADYPGSVATQHDPLDRTTATPTATRRAFGAVAADGSLAAVTIVEVDGTTAETDVTVVHPEARRQGLATAVKAASVLALRTSGVERFRTGGSAENPGIISANTALGYVRDEEWVTLAPPDRKPEPAPATAPTSDGH